MPKRFAYYDTLGTESRRTYRKSDRIVRVELAAAAVLEPLARAIDPALASEDRRRVESACQAHASRR